MAGGISRLVGYIRILRLHFTLLITPSLFLEWYLVSGLPPQPSPLLTPLGGAWLLLLCGIVLNDWIDHAADAVNAPQRPIPSGQVSRHGALLYASVLGLGAALLFWSHGRQAQILVLINLGFIVVDYGFLKPRYRVPGLVSAMTATSGALINLVFWGALAPLGRVGWVYFITSWILQFALHNVNAIRDIKGDRLGGYRSIAAVFGPRAAAWTALLSLAAAAVPGFALFWMTGLPPGPFVFSLVLTTLVSLGLVNLIRRPTRRRASRLYGLLWIFNAVVPCEILIIAL